MCMAVCCSCFARVLVCPTCLAWPCMLARVRVVIHVDMDLLQWWLQFNHFRVFLKSWLHLVIFFPSFHQTCSCINNSDELIKKSTGRFDFHVELRALAIPEREAILKHQVEEHELQCSEEVISEIASKCDGYDAYDLVMFPLCNSSLSTIRHRQNISKNRTFNFSYNRTILVDQSCNMFIIGHLIILLFLLLL
jgi:hypothetical protein